MKLPSNLVVEADLFFSYITSDEMVEHSEKVILAAEAGATKLHVCSEVYDDVVSALRSDGVPIDDVLIFLEKLKVIPHQPLPVTATLAEKALRLYRKHSGPRKLHYFDSFHVATAKQAMLPLVTSDGYILKHAHEFGIVAIDLTTI